MIWRMTYLAKYSNLQMTQKYSERLLMIQINSLQDDLFKRSEKWPMLFNFGKRKCIHIGHETWTKNIKCRMMY